LHFELTSGEKNFTYEGEDLSEKSTPLFLPVKDDFVSFRQLSRTDQSCYPPKDNTAFLRGCNVKLHVISSHSAFIEWYVQLPTVSIEAFV